MDIEGEARKAPNENYVLGRPGFQLAMGAIPEREDEKPPVEIVRGICPECGSYMIANMYWNAQKGYLLRYECWAALKAKYTGPCFWYYVP